MPDESRGQDTGGSGTLEEYVDSPHSSGFHESKQEIRRRENK